MEGRGITNLIGRLLQKDADKHVAKMIEDYNLEDTAIAANENQMLSCQFSELAGFKFMEFSLLSEHEIETYKGCKLLIKTNTNSIELDSDTQEIESLYSPVSNKGICHFEFDLEESLESLIENEEINYLEIVFDKIQVYFDDIDTAKLKELWSVLKNEQE